MTEMLKSDICIIIWVQSR